MNKGLLFIFTFTYLLFLGVSCQFHSKRVEPILTQAESVLEHHPDSALLILHEITNAERLKKKLYYQYFLIELQAKYKNYEDITTDTLVFTIRDYYINKNDLENSALSTFYSGRVFQERKDNQNALQQFLDAQKYLEQSDNLNLKGMCESAIGQIYFDQLIKEKALIHYKIAKGYFEGAQNYKNEVNVSTSIGNCYLFMGKNDSAFYYYNEALKLADKHKLDNLQATIQMNMGVAHRKIGNLKLAETNFKEAMKFSTDSVFRAKLSTNYADILLLQEQKDSAIIYLQKALNYLPQEKNNNVAANIYKRWSAVEENKGNYQEALAKYKLYSKHLAQIISENENSAILEIEKKYNFQLIENQNKQLMIAKQQILMLLMGVLLILALLILLMLRRSVLKERKLKEADRKIYQMKEMARNFNEKENSYRNALIRHFEILKKTALLESYLKKDEKGNDKFLVQKFNEVVYGEKSLNWDVLYQTLNNLGDGIFDRIKTNFPQLNESEFRICCLAYVDFDNTEIALLLNYRINTVEVKKSSIRKKLGIKAFGKIQDFLNNV